MSPPAFGNAWVLTGSTGSGKTEYALRVAEANNAEIVCMDSMTLYRGMDIGTAKPTREERQRIPHHLIDVLEPWESANVAWWLDRAAEACHEIESRGKRALFVGGTPFYLRTLLSGLFEGPPANSEIRGRLETIAFEDGVEALHRRLAEVDAATARRLHPNDLRRVVRALEVRELTGRPISEWQQQWGRESPTPTVARCWWIDLPRPELYRRIESRVERMMAAGWVEEAQRLLELPRPLSSEAAVALGYREIFACLQGKNDLKSAVASIQMRSRQFAKRQLTWFRKMGECRRLDASGGLPDPKSLQELT